MDAFWPVLRTLKPGLEYGITMVPADVWWTWGTNEEFLRGTKYIEVDEADLKTQPHIRLEFADVLRLKVEA